MRQLIEQMLEAMEVWSDARLSAQGQKAITAAKQWLAAPEQSEPNNDEVICTNCTTHFCAIPVNVQRLMLDAGFELPFSAPPLREPEQSEPDWKKPPEYVPPLVKWAQEQTALPLRELSDADKAVEAALNNLLYWTERAVDKGNANSDIEEAMEQYNEALAAARSKT